MSKVSIPKMSGLPDLVLTQNGGIAAAQIVTIDNVMWLLKEIDVEVRLEINTGRVVYVKAGMSDTRADQLALEHLILDMAQRMRMKSVEQVREKISTIAEHAPFHPMEEWLESLKWDGQDWIGQLEATVETSSELWPVYLRKWLIQAVEGVCGWRDTHERSLPYVLTFTGAQGKGKTSWFKKLGGGMGWMMSEAELHLNSVSGKDHQIAVLAKPMAELSELDGIFRKSDISNMKAFISRGVDTIRTPYARNATVKPRMTVFCASVNEAEFLNDPTGSRRFWPIEVEHIAYEHKLDMAQVWAHAYELWAAGESYHLTREEDALRVEESAEFVGTSSIEDMIVNYIRAHESYPKDKWSAMSRTDVMNLLFGVKNHSPKDVSEAGRVLFRILGPHRKIDGIKRRWMVPHNPLARDLSSWPSGPRGQLKLVVSEK